MKLAEIADLIAAESDPWTLRLCSLSIRRIAWSRRARPEAKRLAERADARAAEIEEARGLVPCAPLPRWDEAVGYDGSIAARAIP